jgi:hypothetical protein
MMNATSDNFYWDDISPPIIDFIHNNQQSVIIKEKYNNVSSLIKVNTSQ